MEIIKTRHKKITQRKCVCVVRVCECCARVCICVCVVCVCCECVCVCECCARVCMREISRRKIGLYATTSTTPVYLQQQHSLSQAHAHTLSQHTHFFFLFLSVAHIFLNAGESTLDAHSRFSTKNQRALPNSLSLTFFSLFSIIHFS